jgi:hypothetical protein
MDSHLISYLRNLLSLEQRLQSAPTGTRPPLLPSAPPRLLPLAA